MDAYIEYKNDLFIKVLSKCSKVTLLLGDEATEIVKFLTA